MTRLLPLTVLAAAVSAARSGEDLHVNTLHAASSSYTGCHSHASFSQDNDEETELAENSFLDLLRAGETEISLTAFGEEFVLDVQPRHPFLGAEVLVEGVFAAGSVRGISGSHVRITAVGTIVQGLIDFPGHHDMQSIEIRTTDADAVELHRQMGAAMAVSFKKEGALSSNNIYLYVLYGAVRRRNPWSRLPHRQPFALPSMTLDSPHSASLLGCFFIMVIVVFTLDCHVKKGLRCTSSFLFHCHMLGNCWNVGLLLFLPRWVAVLQRLPWRVRRRWVWRWNWRILERNSRYLVAYICWVFVLNRVPNGRRWNAARLEL